MKTLQSIPLVCTILLASLYTVSQAQEIETEEHHPSCGTFRYLELLANEEKLDETGRHLLQQFESVVRPTAQRNIISKNGHFRIHFDLTGEHAPDPTDLNSNGIPDYIDSVDYYMEYAWQKEIVECGYATPPPDDIAPGEGGIDGRIDVYITALDTLNYGYAQPEGTISNNRKVGYIVIDNDYKNYPTPGIAGLRVTTAHEFHHIVQFSGYRYDFSQAALFEATATWMEYKVHPDLSDYRFYFNSFLLRPQRYPFSTHDVGNRITGYAHMQYLFTIAKQLDDNIVREIWDEFKRSSKSFDAIDIALRGRNAGLNLTNSYCTFARWSYFTGSNTNDTTMLLKASRYPTIVPVQTTTLDETTETVILGNLSPLCFGLWRLSIREQGQANPDNIDFLITNGRSNLGKGGFAVATAEEFVLHVSQTPKDDYTQIQFSSRTLYYKLDAPHPDFCVEVFFNRNSGTLITANPSPQPFINDGADRMVFALNPSNIEVSSVTLDIYSTAMTKVAEINTTGLENLNNVQGVIWDGRMEMGELAPSGVYIYTLKINDSEPTVGKFAVVRK
ncbi:MAG: hypothetical protein KDD67_14225 [Ignavibacteriae bacterium]|nr:hypothetical protein [Ignavibacteriota bacterium]